MVIKHNNKLTGYKCDTCGLVDKTMFSNGKSWMCKRHAEEEYGVDAVKNATVEED